MTVKQLLAGLDARELSEWRAYFQIENEDRKRDVLAERARAGVKQIRKG